MSDMDLLGERDERPHVCRFPVVVASTCFRCHNRVEKVLCSLGHLIHTRFAGVASSPSALCDNGARGLHACKAAPGVETSCSVCGFVGVTYLCTESSGERILYVEPPGRVMPSGRTCGICEAGPGQLCVC